MELLTRPAMHALEINHASGLKSLTQQVSLLALEIKVIMRLRGSLPL